MNKHLPFFRIATEGTCVDGRRIKRLHLEQAAARYDPNVYAARIWLEHIRSIHPDSIFQAYGDVLALKTREITLAGQKRLALYAQLAPSQALRQINKRGQKCYSSIELLPNFAGTGEAYLIGLAIIDSPASIGTEKLQFNQRFAANDDRLISPLEELTMSLNDTSAIDPQPSADAPEITDPNPPVSAFSVALERIKQLFSRQSQHHDTQLTQLLDVLEQTATFSQKTASEVAQLNTDVAGLRSELDQQRQLLSALPAPIPARPVNTGSEQSSAVVTDC